MPTPPERLREHPKNRFDSPQHLFDLDQETEHLRAESLPSNRNHRQQTLYKGSSLSDGPTTVSLFVFEPGASMPQHVARGVVTIHVIEGHLRILAEGREHHLRANQLLVLSPSVQHDVYAQEASRMLLCVCLEDQARP